MTVARLAGAVRGVAAGSVHGARRIAWTFPRAPITAALAALGLAGLLFHLTALEYAPYAGAWSASASGAAAGASSPVVDARTRARLQALAPRGPYLVIDRAHNRLELRARDEVRLSATCSSGSGMMLSDGTREWIFDTPAGRFTVQSKTRNPIWRKPDWAFVEEGLPIPTDPAERLEAGALGEYALYLGDGYLIHGTLYETLLGRSVTHGCIRLGRRDLETVYRQVGTGTPVFIY